MTLRSPNVAAPVTPLQLALALDVVVDAPTVRECADLMRELRAISLGDVWQSGDYRVERDDVTGCDTVRFLRGSHVRGEWVVGNDEGVTSANKLAAALRAIHAELVGTGITTGWLREGLLCETVDETDCHEIMCENATENIGYNKADCEYQQEALLVAQRAVRDSDSVYLFAENMALDHTLPLTLADVALKRHMTVQGSYSVNRDLLLRRDILDPRGDREYALVMKYTPPVPMKRCISILHRGRRDIPSSEFEDGALVCRSCQGIIDHRKRGTSVAAETRKNTWRRMRNGKLGKGGLYLAA